MKVYAPPAAVPFPDPDYRNYDPDAEQAREKRHREDLKKHLVEKGYKGKHTGKVVSFPVADGHAQYMLADGKGAYGASFLIHLPYADAYHFQYASKLSKKDVVQRIELQEKTAALFSKKAAS